MKKIIYSMLFICLFTFSSCEEEDLDTDSSNCDLMLEASNRYADAVNAWSQNQTTANCNTIITRGNAFVRAARLCPEASQSSINQVQNSLDNLDCN